MSKTTRTDIKSKHLDFTLHQHETDSPIIPVVQLEKLHSFRPDLIDWIIRQTEIESDYRRKETAKLNGWIFLGRCVGQASALCIGLGGIFGGTYAAVHNQPWAGATIATAAIGVLAVAFLTGKSPKATNNQ